MMRSLHSSRNFILNRMTGSSTVVQQAIRFSSSNVAVSFKKVSFGYTDTKLLLDDVSFNIRDGAKVTIMGQNGAGKSSIIKLLNGMLQPSLGGVHIPTGAAVATAMQVMPRECRDMTIMEFFTHQLHGNASGIDSRVAKVLSDVQLVAPYDRIVKSFSGGQQARLLLAAALILEPDILLLDEPTNNLDTNGIDHLTDLIIATQKTVVVISHDEDFLNAFSDSVLYLDLHSKKVEQYDGDYHTVKSDITKRIARENSENARLIKAAKAKKDQANAFANKGGGMRKVAKKMRDLAEEMEEDIVTVRKEDVAIRDFTFPYTHCSGRLIAIEKVTVYDSNINGGGKRAIPLSEGTMELERGCRLHLFGPNGIGKTTFLEEIANNNADGVRIHKDATVGYYRQDFNTLDFDSTGISCLEEASSGNHTDQELRSLAAAFLLRGDMLRQKVATLSEGQKGLLSMCCLVLQKPTLLVLDEPTNHINFRHLKALANAIKKFEGAVIVVSHDMEFIRDLNATHTIDLGDEIKLMKKK